MSPVDLRRWASDLRAQSVAHQEAHFGVARSLAVDALTGPERAALVATQRVHECMARRHRQWAEQLEVAAAEIEDAGES